MHMAKCAFAAFGDAKPVTIKVNKLCNHGPQSVIEPFTSSHNRRQFFLGRQLRVQLPSVATIPWRCYGDVTDPRTFTKRQLCGSPIAGQLASFSISESLTMADTRLPNGANSDVVEFIIKNPSGSNNPPFMLRASLASTVLDLKQQLHREYQSKPNPQSQTVRQLENKVIPAPERKVPPTSLHCRSYTLEKF